MNLCKTLFESVDMNKNGRIDPEELQWLIQELYRRLNIRMPGDMKIRLVEDVRRAMKMFDLDLDGTISFWEFLRMLLAKPWSQLLPPQARKQLPFMLLKKVQREHAEAEADSVSADPSDSGPGPVVLGQLERMFHALDTDQSGELEVDELMGLVEEAWFMNDKSEFSSRDGLLQATKEVIAKFDIDDQNGSISFAEFVQMMAAPPFLKMLPKEARDFMILKGAEFKSNPVKKNEAKRVLIEARKLFQAADLDGDGFLEENELANVFQELHRRMGKKMKGDVRVRIVEDCRQIIEKFDQNGTGTLDFVGFVRMLAKKPYSDLLSPEAAKALPYMLLRGLKVDVDKQNSAPRKADGILEYAKQLFDEADVDESGFIDEHELGELIKMLWAKLSKPFGKADQDRLRYEVHAAMQNFDVDDSGTLSFPEFVMLLSKRPWRLMLPKEMQDDILMRGQEVWAEAAPRRVEQHKAEELPAISQQYPPPEYNEPQLMEENIEDQQMMTEEEFNRQIEAVEEHQQHKMALMSQPYVLRQSTMRAWPGDKYPKEVNRKWPSSIPRPRVYVVKNDGEDNSQAAPVMVHSIGNLLDKASKVLGLSRAARRLFIKATGEEIYYLDQIRNNMELAISMGEDFRAHARPRSPSPTRNRPVSPSRHTTNKVKTMSGRIAWVAGNNLHSSSHVDASARSMQNPHATSNVRSWPAGVKRPRVIARHNDGGHRGECFPLLVYSMTALLDEATNALGLARCARKIFDTSGREIRYLEELDNMMEVVISEGEPFRRPRNSSSKRNVY